MTKQQHAAGFLLVFFSAMASAAPAYANLQAPVTSGEVGRDYALALVITVVIEGAVAAAFGVRTARKLAAIALLNAVTNPLFNLGLAALSELPSLRYSGMLLPLLILEVIVVVIEWRVLARVLEGDGWSPRRILWLVITMNAASLVVGNMVLALLPGPLEWHGSALARLTSASRRTALS